MNKKIIIFDFDGTIADTLPHALQVVNLLAVEYGRPIFSQDDFSRMKELSPKEIIKRLKIPLFKIPFLVKRANQEFEKIHMKIQPVKGMPEVIRALHEKKYQLGIVSSNSENNINRFLAANNLQIFDFVHSESNLFGKGKALKHFLQKLKIPVAEAIYVGDEIRDQNAARENQMDIISVTWGFNSIEALKRENPTYLISLPQDLLKVFDNK